MSKRTKSTDNTLVGTLIKTAFITLFVVLIIGVIAIAAATVTALKNQQTRKENVQLPDDTGAWKYERRDKMVDCLVNGGKIETGLLDDGYLCRWSVDE